ncbi:pentapeptide repeat-containing protein [Parafrankia sp. FMc2]|uniref:pentapeptide repeat-containing protein n=1 Tax=Parafrankia sp. FMc2 TaxID=3233196 RepID=UPI0034D4F3AC
MIRAADAPFAASIINSGSTRCSWTGLASGWKHSQCTAEQGGPCRRRVGRGGPRGGGEADLTGAWLDEAILAGAQLGGANLTRTWLGGGEPVRGGGPVERPGGGGAGGRPNAAAGGGGASGVVARI